jgi:chromosome segregation ATPase
MDPRGEGLREVEQRADEIAAEAAGARQENERGTRRGQETDYAFRLPPDVTEADRIRALDDVELTTRQEDVAETQRRAAEALRRNAETLEATHQALDRTAADVHHNRRDVGEIRENAEDLRAQLAQARDRVDRAEIPRVDDGGGGGGVQRGG